jgi:hypothetical protein
MPLMSTLIIVATAFSPSSANSGSHHWPVTTMERLPNEATCQAVKLATERMTSDQSLSIKCVPDEPGDFAATTQPVKHVRITGKNVRKVQD